MEEPKKLWIGAEWQTERDHYGLDKRCGMFSTERFHEDDKGYVPAALPQPVPVEELEQDLEQYITLGSTGCRTIAEDVEFNRLHSKFLAAFRKAAE